MSLPQKINLDPSVQVDIRAAYGFLFRLAINVLDEAGQPFDLNGYSFELKVFNFGLRDKELKSYTGAIDDNTVTFEDAEFTVSRADSFYQIEVTDPDTNFQRWFNGTLRTVKGLNNAGIQALNSNINLGDQIITVNLSPVAGAAGGIYIGASPSSITVGGLPSGTDLTGKTFSELFEMMLVPTIAPTFVAPSNTFTSSQTGNREVGATIASILFNASFNRGQILIGATVQGPRSGLPNAYNYSGSGLPGTVPSTSLTDGPIEVTNYEVQAGANTWQGNVSYDQGPQPLDSAGNPSGSPLSAGSTSNIARTITGIYPWFFGIVSSGGAAPGDNRPTANQTLIDSLTKVVAASSGTITASFNSSNDDYLVFAIPEASTSKAVWFINALNNGAIGGSVSPGGNLFPAPTVVSIDSPDSLWIGVNYKIYISNFQSEVSLPMELRNS